MEPTRDELLARIKELEAERDAYKRHLAALLDKMNHIFTREEIEDLGKDGIPFESIVQEVKQMFKSHELSQQVYPSA